MIWIKIIALLIFVGLTNSLKGQTATTTLVDSLQFLESDTLDCSADIFWRIVAQRDNAVPFLIEKLTDLSPTRIKDPCKATPLNVSEVAYYALRQIADFPLYLVAEMQFDSFDGNGCTGFHRWYFFSDSLAHKQEFKDKVKNWWSKNRLKYKWVEIPKERLTPCQKVAGIHGRYKWTG
jgi:hypothetical protein